MEDYEKKYKDALAKAREIHRNEDEKRFDMEWLFPELAESEDERIRRNIIAALKGEGYYDCDLTNECIAWLEKQGNNTPTIIWHNIDEKPEEMKELFCEWESDDATWHDVAFYDEESHTFRHAKMPINVTKWVYVDELLEKQGEQKPAKNIVKTWKDMRLEVYQQASGNRHEPNYSDDTTKMFSLNDIDEIIEKMSEQNPADKVEPKFKVKYAGSEYNVFETKDIAGVTFYGIEDEPNHIDYVKADNCEIISGYGIKESGLSFPTKPAIFSEQKPAEWSYEDEENLNNVIGVIERRGMTSTVEQYKDILYTYIRWLKSLKERIGG